MNFSYIRIERSLSDFIIGFFYLFIFLHVTPRESLVKLMNVKLEGHRLSEIFSVLFIRQQKIITFILCTTN